MSLFWIVRSLFTSRSEQRRAGGRRPLLGLAALGLTAISCHGSQPPAEATARDAPEAMTSAKPSPAPTPVTPAASTPPATAAPEAADTPELHAIYPAAIAEIIPLLPGSSAPAPESLDHATRTLPPALLTALTGCWERDNHSERWQLDRSGTSELTVIRHVETDDADYARRAKIPSPLLYDAAKGTLGFTAAGRIHALFFAFTRPGATLEAYSFSSHEPGAPYHFTGSRMTLERCAARPAKP